MKQQLDWSLIRRLLTFLAPYKYSLAAAVLSLFAAKAVEAAVPFFIGKVTQKIVDGGIDFSAAAKSCLILMGALLLSYGFEAVNVFLKSGVGQKALFRLRNRVYSHILSLPQKEFDRIPVGKLMTRTIHDVDQINQMFTESVVPIIGNAMLFICILISVYLINWRVGAFVTCLLPIIFLHTNSFRRAQRLSFGHVRAAVSAMNGFVQEHLMGATIIRSFGLQRREEKKFSTLNEKLKEAHMETIHNFAFFIAGIDMLISSFLIAVFILLVLYAPSTGFRAGDYFAFSLYALMIFRPLSDLAERYNLLQSAVAAAERIFSLLDKEPEPEKEGEALLDEIRSIEFRDVWFAYKEERWVLKGLCFHLEKGDSLALVGVTGAGKSSIVSLLLRLYPYQKGSILINGQPVETFSRRELRRHFAVVLQDPVIFSGTVAENISLFGDGENIEKAIDYVNLGPLLTRFPEREAHLLTERGQSLSVGEMQLIAFARAVAANSSIVILDEATANIDSPTEKRIQEALEKILTEKSSIIIAHRLSTIKHATRILVIHNGRVAESGTHSNLLKNKGLYESLYRLQFAT